jgi:hypothetical protein
MLSSRGTRFEHVLKQTASFSSEYLDELVQDLAEAYPVRAWSENPALETIRAALLAQSVRAADNEGRMVTVSDLAKMLRAKKYRSHLKKKYHSNTRVGREFGIADNTVANWLKAAKEQVVAADNLSPEALDRLARIMTPRRGPRAGQRQNTPRE